MKIDIGEGQCCLTEIFVREKVSSLVSKEEPSVLGEPVRMWRPKCGKVRKPWILRWKRWSLGTRVSDEEQREQEVKVKRHWKGAVAQKDKRGLSWTSQSHGK